MKILFVLENYYPHIGGVETLFQTLAEKLAQKHTAVVITSQQPNTKNLETYHGVKIVRVKVPDFAQRYFFTVFALPYVYRYAKLADIIHTTTYNAALPAWVIGKLLNKPVVITVHEVLGPLWFKLPMPWLSQCLHYVFEKLVVSLPFTKYITDSEYTKNCLLTHYGRQANKVQRIYCGIDYHFWKPYAHFKTQVLKQNYFNSKPETFIYLFFGRPGWVKGIETLVKAVPQISKVLPQSKLVLMLSREPANRRQKISQLIQELGVEKNVQLLFSVTRNELPAIIKAADCVVIPSISEGFGFAAVESLALKVPVIARNAGSLTEVVDQDWLFFDEKQLVQLLLQLAHGKKYTFPVKHFPLSLTVSNYEYLYQSII